MKAISIITVCLALCVFSSVAAAPRVGQRSVGICTSDFNLWGHSGQCSCDQSKVYDPRAGLCLESGETEKITVQGAVSAGMAAIGGETTGFEIKTKAEDSYELILKVVDQEKMSTLDGMWFEIEGELITIESVERKERKAIIVEKTAVLE
ncbi:MAG: hypothetical protein ACR2PB_01825 [Desulfocapsaceae bacterium]